MIALSTNLRRDKRVGNRLEFTMSQERAVGDGRLEPKISLQMRAVLTVLAGDPHLMDTVCKFVDFKNNTVQWDQIFAAPMTEGQQVAFHWAYAFWFDDVIEQFNVFKAAHLMNHELRLAVLRALRLRWGLQK